MLHGKIEDSIYSKTIKSLVKRIHDTSQLQDSLYEQAIEYFTELDEVEKQLAFAQKNMLVIKTRLETNTDKKKKAGLEDRLESARKTHQILKLQEQKKRLARHNAVVKVCNEILDLLNGRTKEDINNNTAKMLGTLKLLSRSDGSSNAQTNQRRKHLYKAALCLKLLDYLLEQKLITNSFILRKRHEHLKWKSSKEPDKPRHSPFRTDVQIPLVIAALFQDVGYYHPDAQIILHGANGNLDEFRPLPKDERSRLLKISYQQALRYVTFGIGKATYRGNSREDRELFYEDEQDKLDFTRTLLKTAINPNQGIGNLLKVPQVYCSVVMSTKQNYSYDRLPRVKLVMDKGASVGAYSSVISKSLIEITGVFPQGYGITYIPKDSEGQDLDRYEYGIVVGLFPEDIEVPECRIATRNLAFNAFGVNIIVGKKIICILRTPAKNWSELAKNACTKYYKTCGRITNREGT